MCNRSSSNSSPLVSRIRDILFPRTQDLFAEHRVLVCQPSTERCNPGCLRGLFQKPNKIFCFRFVMFPRQLPTSVNASILGPKFDYYSIYGPILTQVNANGISSILPNMN